VEENTRNYSKGIKSSQAEELKSRKGVSKMSQDEQWKHVWRIVFPDHDGAIPSSSCKKYSFYMLWQMITLTDESPSESATSTVHKICEDPSFQELLGNTVGEELVPKVCRLLSHYAEKHRVTHGDQEEEIDPAENSDQEVVTPAANNNVPIETATHINNMGPEHLTPIQGMHFSDAAANKNSDPAMSLYYDNYAPHPMGVYFPPIPRLTPSSGRQPHSDSGFGTHHSMDHSGPPQDQYRFGGNCQDPSKAQGHESSSGLFPFNFAPTNLRTYPASDPTLASPYASNLWTANNALPDVRQYKNNFSGSRNVGGSEHSYKHQEDSLWSANAETPQWSNNSGGQGPFGSSHKHGFEDAA
jgi:hypothetical protein